MLQHAARELGDRVTLEMRIGRHENARTQLIGIFIAGMGAVITWSYFRPDMQLLASAIGFFGIAVALSIEHLHCLKIEELSRFGKSWEKGRDHDGFHSAFELHFPRYEFTKFGWFALAGFVLMIALAVFAIIA